MASKPANSPYPRNWNAPYSRWTGADLLIANFLRPVPHTYADLAAFALHSPDTLRVIGATLRREGRLTHDNQVVRDHPSNQALAGTPKLEPLPDLGHRPRTQTTISAQLEARTLADRVMSDSATVRGHRRFDRAAARALLEEWITSGSAGKETPTFMRAWLDLSGTDSAGPPAPASTSDETDRLLRLLRSARPASAARAIFLFQQEPTHADPLLPREAPPLHPDHHQSHLAPALEGGVGLSPIQAGDPDHLPPPQT